MSDDAERESWRGEFAGAVHVVELEFGWFTSTISWSVDGEQVARVSTGDDRHVVSADGLSAALLFQKARFSESARRIRLFAADTPAAAQTLAATGVGGEDLDPAPGTRAARRQQRMLQHPVRYTVERTLSAAAAVALPILAIWILAQLLGAIPWPEISLPRLPEVELPTIIDLPEVDLPTIVNLPEAPGWLEHYAGFAASLVPVLVALVVSRREIARRRRHLRDIDSDRSPRPTAPGPGPGPRARSPYDQDADSASS